MEVAALVDTGSEVSTISESWFHSQLPSVPLKETHLLKLRAANGDEMPYCGVTEVNVAAMGNFLERMPFLVTKDSLSTTGRQRQKLVPVILGMNTLPYLISLSSKETKDVPTVLQPVIGKITAESKTVTGIARVADRGPTHCPAWSTVAVRVTGPARSTHSLLAMQLNNSLPQGLLLAPSLTSADPTKRYVRILNVTDRDILLPGHTPVAFLQSITEIASDSCVLNTYQNSQLASHEQPADDEFPCPNFDGTTAQRRQLMELLKRHKGVFSKGDDDLGFCDIVRHQIKTTDENPINQAYRSIPPRHYEEVKQHLHKLLNAGVIKESYSPYAAPIVLVRKKDGSLRLCVDYRRLNARTVRDAYPLPRLLESFDSLGGAQYFSTLDLASGYHQIAMDPQDQFKTAFSTPFGLFEYKRMPMGLSNAPATFQRLMQSVMSDFLFSFALVYLDDLLIYSRTFDEHLEHLDRLLTRIGETGLKLKMSKCQLLRREVTYLGHTISAEGIGCDTEKTSAVKSWPTPLNTRDVVKFVSFASYFRRFVKNFAQIAGPLHDLINKYARGKNGAYKSVPISQHWEQQHEDSFQRLKAALTSADVLAFADFERPFQLEVDASHDGLGAILSQQQPTGKTKVIAFASRRLRPTEKNHANYNSFKLELLALKWAVTEKFRHYLIGGHFTVLTDNNPLTHLQTAKLGATEQRWYADLCNFDFDIKYRPGKTNPADGLSRIPLAPVPEEISTTLPAHVACVLEAWCERLHADASDQSNNNKDKEEDKQPGMAIPHNTREDIARLQQEDTAIRIILDAWPAAPDTRNIPIEAKKLARQHGRLEKVEDVLYRNVNDPRLGTLQQLVLPASLRPDVLAALHDNMGHQGVHRTTTLLQQRAYWPGMHDDVKNYISQCQRCQLNQRPRGKTPMGHLLASRPLEVLAMDFTVLEPASDYRENVLVMTDVFLKITLAVPRRDHRAEIVAKTLYGEWFRHCGVPLRIHSDQGRNFESASVRNVRHTKVANNPYHLEGNAQSERFNRTMHDLLRSLPPEKL